MAHNAHFVLLKDGLTWFKIFIFMHFITCVYIYKQCAKNSFLSLTSNCPLFMLIFVFSSCCFIYKTYQAFLIYRFKKAIYLNSSRNVEA